MSDNDDDVPMGEADGSGSRSSSSSDAGEQRDASSESSSQGEVDADMDVVAGGGDNESDDGSSSSSDSSDSADNDGGGGDDERDDDLEGDLEGDSNSASGGKAMTGKLGRTKDASVAAISRGGGGGGGGGAHGLGKLGRMVDESSSFSKQGGDESMADAAAASSSVVRNGSHHVAENVAAAASARPSFNGHDTPAPVTGMQLPPAISAQLPSPSSKSDEPRHLDSPSLKIKICSPKGVNHDMMDFERSSSDAPNRTATSASSAAATESTSHADGLSTSASAGSLPAVDGVDVPWSGISKRGDIYVLPFERHKRDSALPSGYRWVAVPMYAPPKERKETKEKTPTPGKRKRDPLDLGSSLSHAQRPNPAAVPPPRIFRTAKERRQELHRSRHAERVASLTQVKALIQSKLDALPPPVYEEVSPRFSQTLARSHARTHARSHARTAGSLTLHQPARRPCS
jgi:hypothetical protein